MSPERVFSFTRSSRFTAGFCRVVSVAICRVSRKHSIPGRVRRLLSFAFVRGVRRCVSSRFDNWQRGGVAGGRWRDAVGSVGFLPYSAHWCSFATERKQTKPHHNRRTAGGSIGRPNAPKSAINAMFGASWCVRSTDEPTSQRWLLPPRQPSKSLRRQPLRDRVPSANHGRALP